MNGSLNKGSLVKGGGSGGGGSIPSQEGQAGKVLSTNGEQLEWVEGYKPNLFDIKTNSEPTAQKGWSCISYPTQNKLDKADVPTAYDMLAQKLAGADATISGWQSLGNNYIGFIVDDNVIIDDVSIHKIYHAKIVDIDDNTKWNLLVDNEDFMPLNRGWVINDIIYIFTSQKNLLMINKNTFEIIKTLHLNTNNSGIQRVGFTDGYLYLMYYDSVHGYYCQEKIKYSLVADEITNETLQNTSSVTLIFRYSNGYYYFAQSQGSSLYFLYKATDVTDSSTYIYLDRLDRIKINAVYSDYNGNLIGISYETGTIKVTTNIDNWTTDLSTQTWEETVLDFTDYGSAYTTPTGIEYFYRSQNGFVFVFSCPDKKIALYSDDLTNFNLIVELDSNFGGVIDCNGSFALYNATLASTLYYSSPTPTFTEYTDTINGIDIKYYKNGNYKICTPDIAVGNDDNLQSVFEYLGYLNYWWIDTANEQITLQRNSNLWTMMYVGDDYEDDELPSGNSTRLLPQKNYVEDTTSATISFDEDNIIQPNTDYVFGTLTSLEFDTDSYIENQLETTIKFTAGENFSFTDSSNIVWVDGTPTFTEGSNYLILIFNNLAFIREW